MFQITKKKSEIKSKKFNLQKLFVYSVGKALKKLALPILELFLFFWGLYFIYILYKVFRFI